MPEETRSFINSIYLKSALIYLEKAELQEIYSNNEEYERLIKSLSNMIYVDDTFLLLESSFIEKIEDIIYLKRYDINNKELIELTNDIISYINHVKNYPEHLKNIKINNYIIYHEDVRSITFTDYNDFINCIGDDFIIYKALEQGDIDNINSTKFFGTTNYFLEYIPELYKNNTYREITEKRLSKIIEENGILHFQKNKNIKITLNNFQKIKTTKGE